MHYKYILLKQRIIQKYGSYVVFADVVGVSKQSVFAKLEGEKEFSQEDISNWSKVLDLSLYEAKGYFFS